MIEYLSGQIIEINPAHLVIEVQGVGYFVNISVNTYSKLSGAKSCRIYIHEAIREDAHTLYGFFDVDEREMFRYLISVSGIGASTGVIILSSMTTSETAAAISGGDVDRLKSVKGIGAKTAQRVIVELKDKMNKMPTSSEIFAMPDNTMRTEALSALVTLGFVKKAAETIVDKIIKQTPNVTVETIIKEALKQM